MPRRSLIARYRAMSFLARYFSSLRRLPTSSSSPRRLWWSCLCTFRCSVRWLIRLVSSATWTSGEPVSPSLVAYSARISFLTAVSSGTWLLKNVGSVEDSSPARPPHEGAAGLRLTRLLAGQHFRLPRAARRLRRVRRWLAGGVVGAGRHAHDPRGGGDPLVVRHLL